MKCVNSVHLVLNAPEPLYSVQYSSKQYRGLQAGEYPCGPIVANYLWACNGKVSISLFCGLFCTCGMQKLGIIQE